MVFTLIFKVFGFQSPFLWFSDGEEKRWTKNNIITRIQRIKIKRKKKKKMKKKGEKEKVEKINRNK